MLTRSGMARRLRHVPAALAASGALLVIAAIVALLAGGPVAAVGALAGVGLVSVSYVLSHLCIAAADESNPALVMPVGLATYAAKLVTVGLVLALLVDAGWSGVRPMVFAVAASVVVWTTAQAVWVWRARVPYVEVEGR